MIYLNADQIEIELIHNKFFYSHIRKEEYFPDNKTGRVIEHYELDIFTQGTAKLILDDIPYCYEPGSICFRKPGQINQQIRDYRYACYSLFFSVYRKETGELIDGSKNYSCFLDHIPEHCEPENFSAILQIISDLQHTNQISSEREVLKQKMCTSQILYELYPLSKKEQNHNSSAHPAVKKAISYFYFNLDTDISMKEVASYVGLSEKYFQRVFKQSTGITPNTFCMQLKLETAAKKLLATKKTVSEIAYESGFSSCAYFNYVFKKNYNQTPIEYRNRSN